MRKRKSASLTVVMGTVLAASLVLGVGSMYGTTLEEMYDAAGAGEGYDKFVILERGKVYTGRLIIPTNTSCCILGNGAICDTEGLSIRASAGVTLDIFDTVITNHYALYFEANSQGYISGNTITDGYYGIRCVNADVVIENNIVVNNSYIGVAADSEMLPVANYNDVWNNAGGNYMEYCSG